MAEQVVITNEEAVKTIAKYAEQKGISKAEAGASLIRTAKGRINAVRKYAAEHAAAPKAKAKAKAPAKAKAKAKAPRVRKPKADAPAEPSTAQGEV
jgi:hypothetical protein